MMVLGLGALLFVWGAPVFADSIYGFYNITGNNMTNAAIGEAQMFVTVSDAGSNQVLFKFDNTGPAASSITDVYFDNGTLLGIASLSSSGSGVDFSQGASPPNLPGGSSISPAFVTTTGFSADSDPPAQPNGVNPDEWLGVLFNLQGGGAFADVISELGTGELRIGIHVQGFADGGSESFVNTPVIPLPPAFLLGLSLLSGLGLVRGLGGRRRTV
ncbi:MAG: hypothetical protein A2V98_10300 [Planctomycetes bacterium RBG_16_64_12]|nr:MAG: hypothetical protein A2V98_10300 [Planctomycetes bacterium RBG_16_64_12]